MRVLLCLAVAGLAACWAAGAPPNQSPPPTPPSPLGGEGRVRGESNYQDIVHFAEKRPILFRLHVTVGGRPLPAVWGDYVTKVFKYLDTNGDGVLDRNEVQRVPSPDVLFGGDYGGAIPTLIQLDTRGNGKVTRDDLAAWFRRLGATPFQVPGGSGQDLQRMHYQLAILAAEQELLVARGGVGIANPDSVNDTLFKLLDTNGDGKLSKEELAAAPAVLLKRDRNDDEMITPDEIVPGTGRRGDEYTLARLELLRASYYLHAQQRGGNGPFWLVHAGASKIELARQLQRRYANGNKKGQSPRTKLSRQDLGLDEATFVRLDVDDDGLLDAEELARFACRPPDLELKVELGPKASVELVKSGLVLEPNVRPGKDGVLMLELNGTRLDLKALATQKVDAAQAARQEREQYLKAFKEADRDNNGYLDMSEAMRSPLYRNLFKAMDRDGDGMLFEKEVLAYLDVYQELQAAARASCATVGITSEGKGLFELLDTNGDGRLSVRELRNAVKLIAELDRDGDGAISRTEIPRCSQAAFRLGPASGGGNLGYYPASLGSVVRSGRGNNRTPPQPVRGPEWFRKMDRNGDGDVSRKEFLGTDAQFREIDTDGDGLISLQEAEAYEKKRQQRDPK